MLQIATLPPFRLLLLNSTAAVIFKGPTMNMPFRVSRRRVVQRTRNATMAGRDGAEDSDLVEKRDRLYKMANNLNELGAGFFECLKDTKTCYQVHLLCLYVIALESIDRPRG